MTLQTVRAADELRGFVRAERQSHRRIAFVPTLGNLHAGHFSLIDLAQRHADCVVASVFVNPTQFGHGEDFARYPRTPDADAAGLAAHGCSLLFLPDVATIYPLGPERTVRVHVPELSEILEGVHRPGHFDGVATVVAKLFHLVEPDIAVFGLKDFQQWLVVNRMVRDLAFPVELIGAPTVREPDGLALSSRNQYLDASERVRAGVIHATLGAMAAAVRAGAPFPAIEAEALARLRDSGFEPDYAVARRRDDLGVPSPDQREGLVALIAARLGRTRLIDNLFIGP